MDRVLTGELARAKQLLEEALAILDRHKEQDAAIAACDAIEILSGAPSPLEQWYQMTGRNADGSDRDGGDGDP